MSANTFEFELLTVTEAAQEQIVQIMDEEYDENLVFRVGVVGGGCNGFEWTMALGPKNEDDTAVKLKDSEHCVYIDALSYQFVVGATLDYEAGLTGQRFTMKSNLVTSQCSCGSSISF